jgi:predicted nucleic acid-binding protein
MRCLVFDAGPIISLTMNNLLWLLEQLKSRYVGEFYISRTVKDELIDRPLQTKKFKFEALQVLQYVTNDVLKVVGDDNIKEKAIQLLELANHSFMARGQYVNIVHFGEMEALAAALLLHADALVVDERTTRYLIDKPEMLVKRMEQKLHTHVEIDRLSLQRLKELVKGIKVIRSVELVAVAFEKGLLDLYITEKEKGMMPDIRKNLLESVLWTVKLNGCAVAESEINDILRFEKVV